MTEAEWLACTDPTPMLECLMGRASDRKARLFGVLCCRQNEDLFRDPRFHAAFRLAERYGDGQVGESERARVESEALDAYDSNHFDELEEEYMLTPARLVGRRYPIESALADARDIAYSARWAEGQSFEGIDHEFRLEQSDFLRDLFGNLFRSVPLDPRWLTSTAIALARTIYEERAFDRLPILADALEDAGCDDADILAHCRGDGPHVRGCWVVDLILGKE